VIAANGANIRLRTLDDYRTGMAVAWDVTGTLLHHREPAIEPITPAQAGTALAHLAQTHDLVFFETFLPDLAAHERLGQNPRIEQITMALELIDALIGATLAAMRPTDTLLLTSDHGNIESLAAKSHTRHPVPLLVIGPAAKAFAHVTTIAEVAGTITAALTETQ
jgi:2,3-bisphosphoglycerate-independent phosphoglycerate mutase